jgi:aminoglycoside phosphotransferase (APT) family kinase protein
METIRTIAEGRTAWRPPPSPVRILQVAGWLSDAEAAASSLRVESLSRSHDVFRVVAPDGRSAIVKQVPQGAWDSGRSLVRELFVYRVAAWLTPLAAVVPRALFIDERRQILVLEDLGDAAHNRPHDASAIAALARSMASWHAATRDVALLPSPSPGILWLPESLDVATRDRSESTQRYLTAVAEDATFRELLNETASGYRAGCLIHGDLRLDNWRTRPATNGAGIDAVALDWDLSGAGDPVWDVGCVCADVVLERIRAIDTIDSMETIESRTRGDNAWPARAVAPIVAFVRAYAAAANMAAESASAFWNRVTLCAIARLLHVGSEWTDQIADDQNPLVVRLLDEARLLIARRTEASRSLHEWARS